MSATAIRTHHTAHHHSRVAVEFKAEIELLNLFPRFLFSS
jgi:hypothetical protein